MALMALDHASAFVARHHAQEFWAGDLTAHGSPLSFLIRFVTHLCAPGFLFLAGAGLELFARSRRAAGWSAGRIARTLVIRGLLLVVINQLIENPAWILGMVLSGPAAATPAVPGGGGVPFLVTGVLTALGLTVAIGGALLPLRTSAWLLLAVLAFGATSLLTPAPDQAATLFHPLARLLLIPGQTGILIVIYPLVPWFAFAALGVVFARALAAAPDRTMRVAPWIGLALLVVAIALRAAGGFGNLRLPRDGTWIEFFNYVKYPPALVFSLFMLGTNLLLLTAITAAGERLGALGRSLERFGSVPLFFYISHLYLYAIAGAFFRPPLALAPMMLVWLAGLVPLGWLCARYRDFKRRRPIDSIWRMF